MELGVLCLETSESSGSVVGAGRRAQLVQAPICRVVEKGQPCSRGRASVKSGREETKIHHRYQRSRYCKREELSVRCSSRGRAQVNIHSGQSKDFLSDGTGKKEEKEGQPFRNVERMGLLTEHGCRHHRKEVASKQGRDQSSHR